MAEKEKVDYKSKIAKLDKRMNTRDERANKWRDKLAQVEKDNDRDKLEKQILQLKDKIQDDEEKVAQASTIVGIAYAARDVFGQDLPVNREEARAAMQRVINQAKQHNNQ